MHSAFLFHAVRAGLDMGIVNAGQLAVYQDIPADLLGLVEDVLFDRREGRHRPPGRLRRDGQRFPPPARTGRPGLAGRARGGAAAARNSCTAIVDFIEGRHRRGPGSPTSVPLDVIEGPR